MIYTTPLTIGILAVFMLVLFAGREVIHAFLAPKVGPERGLSVFNACALVVLAASLGFGMVMFVQHEAMLSTRLAPYPLSRYAPEREALTPGSQWIYITKQPLDMIMEYIRRTKDHSGYGVTIDQGTTSVRVLFEKGSERIFLTVTDEGNERVLYYSDTGEVRTVSIPE